MLMRAEFSGRRHEVEFGDVRKQDYAQREAEQQSSPDKALVNLTGGTGAHRIS
jgi:hypothetical protein